MYDFKIPRPKYHEDGTKIRPARRRIALGSKERRILKTETIGGKEYSYHATKGWRVVREARDAGSPASILYASFLG